jgi:hypothetical protein
MSKRKKPTKVPPGSVLFDLRDEDVESCIRALIEMERYEFALLQGLLSLITNGLPVSDAELAEINRRIDVVNAMLRNFENRFVTPNGTTKEGS